MKIALPTNDGTSLSPHFGRSTGFLVYEIQDGRPSKVELRPNAMQHSHEQGACGHGEDAHQPHGHGAILQALADCDVVICAGMGGRAAEALRSAGITEIVVAAPGVADQTVAAYLAGTLPASGQGFCRCSH